MIEIQMTNPHVFVMAFGMGIACLGVGFYFFGKAYKEYKEYRNRGKRQ